MEAWGWVVRGGGEEGGWRCFQYKSQEGTGLKEVNEDASLHTVYTTLKLLSQVLWVLQDQIYSNSN